ncbi:GNAT family N-acetyltransferase [Shewanella sp. AS16]|uniref:GNAT family N-acetyltransferase n=1 Tax=Shewanella sp. AS16 TaxID=2907625 RepID=UPI001F2339D1|nr:GNAT family protein [Shewanella sp. AS16]MCE9685649.1 GNAT family N-acetyltransferase [Shewanella sp. AS16]
MWIKSEVLEGEFVVLEPLAEAHVPALAQAVRDGESWKLWFANVPAPGDMGAYVANAMAAAADGDIAYAVRAKATDKIVGTTRYYQVDAGNKRAMLGYTWYADSVRRTPINTECKLLLLNNLFESCDAIAVEFRTHFFNLASRAAIERLGAKQDGILRHHMIMKDGSLRDTVIYSIVAGEWPAVKRNLLSKLGLSQSS